MLIIKLDKINPLKEKFNKSELAKLGQLYAKMQEKQYLGNFLKIHSNTARAPKLTHEGGTIGINGGLKPLTRVGGSKKFCSNHKRKRTHGQNIAFRMRKMN